MEYPYLKGLTTTELIMLINDTTDLKLLERAEQEFVDRMVQTEDMSLEEFEFTLKDV